VRQRTLAEIATAVGGTVDETHAGVLAGPEVVTDSREATPGSLYVARVGEHSDGHRFIAGALAAGAAGALVRADRAGGDVTIPRVVVTDTDAALQRLARTLVDEAVERGLVVVGITGSMGKTSTKDLLAGILARRGPTVAPRNSFNTEVGVALTASRIDHSTQHLVSEMGARGIGHIAVLCRISPPRVGVVLNVAHAHIGEFGSQQAIAQAKGELVEALPADGWAVLNADDPLVAAMADRTRAHLAWFGGRPAADPVAGQPGFRVWAEEIGHDTWGRYGFVLHARGHHPEHGPLTGRYGGPVRLATAGRAQVDNALAAAAAAIAAGMPPADVAAGLDGARVTSHWRMELTELADTTVVVNDAYNANPDAMVAAITTAATMAADNGRRLGVVLGDMLELGDEAAEDHAALGRAVATATPPASWAVFVGDWAEVAAEAAVAAGMARESVAVVQDGSAASAAVSDLRHPGDVVLVKGSRGMALETVVDALSSKGDDPLEPPIRTSAAGSNKGDDR